MMAISLLIFGCASTGPSAQPSAEQSQGLLYSGGQKLLWPVKGKVTSYFGRRHSRWHEGVDIMAPKGAPIRAAAHGEVVSAGWQKGYGMTVVVRHRSFKTLYAHCRRVYVKKGDEVGRGETIAAVGNTGNARGYHLHFEVRSLRWSALNPLDYLPLRFAI